MSDAARRAPAHMPMPRGPGGHAIQVEKAQNARQALRRLLEYFRQDLALLVLAMVVAGLGTALGLVGPFAMGKAIDEAMHPGGDEHLLAVLCGVMAAAYVASSGLQAWSARLIARVSQSLLRWMRRDLFAHMQTLPLRFYDARTAGDLMSRLTNDMDAINNAVAQNLTGMVTSVIGMVGILGVMLLLNPWLTLAAMAMVPVLLGSTTLIAQSTRSSYRALQLERGSLNGTIEESISGQRVVKAFRRSRSTLEEFGQRNEAVFQAAVKAQSWALLLMPLTNALGNLFVVVLAGVGSWLALKGMATVGTIAAFITYGQRFIDPLRQLGNIYNTLQAALAGAERVFEVLDATPERPDAPDATSLDAAKGAVEFDHVGFGYVPGTPVLVDMSFTAKAGQMVALVGPTGAGKTTFVNLLMRFYDVDQGCIRLDGVDIQKIKLESLRRKMGMVLQDTFLFSGSVLDNIRYGRLDATDEECHQAAQLAEADYFIHQLPHGYATQLSERGANLSQGQRQLITIARALLADPTILILDEATSSVDTRTEKRIQSALKRLMKNRTSFVIAHRLATIREADLLLVIKDGRIVESGTHAELLARGGVFHQLYEAQFKGHAV